MDEIDQLVNDIYSSINKKNFIYLIQATQNFYTSGLYEIEDGKIFYLNETVEVFKIFPESIQRILKNIGLLIIYPNEQHNPEQKKIKYYNPELFTDDLFELVIFQEFGFQPKALDRQKILEVSIKKEKIKDTLVYACFENNTEKIFEVLENIKKSQLDMNLKYTGTPLGLCVANKNVNSFKAIAKAGANLSKKSLGTTPLQLAFKYSSEIVDYIYSNHKDVFEKEVNKQGFYIVADSTDLNMLKLVKDFGADLNKYDKAFPHLHNFADRNNVVGLGFCLDNGIDINMKDKQGRTALDKAIMRNHKESIEFLRKKGAMETIRFETS